MSFIKRKDEKVEVYFPFLPLDFLPYTKLRRQPKIKGDPYQSFDDTRSVGGDKTFWDIKGYEIFSYSIKGGVGGGT